jgi:hypothetical protein
VSQSQSCRGSQHGVRIQCFVIAFVLLLATLANGQASLGTGRVEGTIADSSGAAIADSTVLIANQDTGISFTQKSDSTGHFMFLSLPPGSYQVTIQKEGFKTDVSSDVLVKVGTTTNLQRQLVVGAMSMRVSVVAQAPLVDTSQSGLSDVVDQKSISSLPLNGRNFTDFVLLTPGVSTDGDFGMISFNGLAGNYNNYTVDGANDNNAFFEQQIGRTSIPFQFSEDVVQEFQVISNGSNAEFGQAGGGVVNTVTKSGTNQFHGDGYYYFLDSELNANDKINEQQGISKPHNRRQQFGTTVGGPLVHDRLFWLANYESQIRNEPLTVNEGPAIDGLPANYLTDHPDVASLVSAAAGSHARSFNQNTAFGKVSGVLSAKNTFDVSYNYQRFRSPHGYFNTPTSTGDGLSLTDGATSHFMQFTLHTAFSATMVNEFRFHYGNDFHFDLPDTAPAGPAVVIQNPDSGVVFGGNRFQLSTSDRRLEFGDNLTRVWGRHTVKAGVDINVNHDRDYFVYGPHGAYFFSDLVSVGGDPTADPVLPPGNFEYYLQSFGQSTAIFTVPTYSLFGQDQFRLNNRLTINYGVRWDLQKLPKPPNCNPGFLMTCNIPYSKNNVAPRFGFAYALDQKNSTVVRGAFGLFYAMTDLLDVSEALLSNGINRQFLFVAGPAFCAPCTPIVTYPNYLTTFPTGAGGNPSLVVFSPKFRSPYVEQGSLQIERQFGSRTALSVGYVYTHGLQLLGNSNGVTRQANGNFGLDINLYPPVPPPDTLQMPNGKVYTVPDYAGNDGYLNSAFNAINEVDNSGKSIYHGLQVSLRHSSSQFQGGVSYTFSKTIDQGTGYYNQFAIASQRGPSQLDQPHRLVLTGTWSPTQHYTKGFMLGSVMTFASGRPFEPELDVPNVNFKMVPGEGFNSFRGPGVNNIDLNLARVVKINERMSIKFVAEAFDLLNHPNFQQSPVNQVQYTTLQPDTNVPFYLASPNPDFGKPLAVAPRYGARAIQLSARFSF